MKCSWRRRCFFASALAATALGFAGCAHDVHKVWSGNNQPPATLQAPPGFTVKPAQAWVTAFKSNMLSIKHPIHLYADRHFYYAADPFLGMSGWKARRVGIRIDGKTGRIATRENPALSK